MPGGRVPGEGHESERPPGPIFHRHVQDMLAVLEEGNQPLLRCPKCNMFVRWRALNGNHHTMVICSNGAEKKLKWLREEEAQSSNSVALQSCFRPLETAKEFKYLGQVLEWFQPQMRKIT